MRSFECDFEKTQDSSFKHYETKAELEHMKQEYSALTEAYLKLEKENISNYSQIQSMRLALDCHSSYQVNKEIDLNIRISELEKALDCLRLDKASSSSKFLGQLNAKETYIEHLLTTLLNLHQKIEYCKDDLSKTQKDYHKQQKTLESETSLRETLENLYTKSLCEIEEFKQNLTTITKEYKETKHLSETIATTLKSDYEHEQNEEISLLTKNYESKLLMLTSSYNLKLSTQERSHKEMINSVSKYMNIRIESIKNYYETRITKMIQDYSFQEAKFHSKLADLSLLYSNMRDMCKQIEEELLGKSSFIHIVTEERKELIRQKKELDSYLEKISFEHKLSLSSTQKEMEIMRERLSEKQKELKEEYEKKVNFISTNKSLSVEGIRAKYERELQKVSKSSSENSAKLEKFHESQCLTMLEELAKLESEKTDLSIRLDCQIKEIQNDAEYVMFK